MTDRACVHTGNASEQFLLRNRTLILVHIVSEQLLKLAKTYPLQCEHSLNQSDMAKQLLTPLRLIACIIFLLKNYDCELLNLTGTVGKVELISTLRLIHMYPESESCRSESGPFVNDDYFL